MAVAVSRDLSVQVLEDSNTVKLTNNQQNLRDGKQRGQPKCIGVSQMMLGLMVISYSIPLHLINFTEVVSFGVPWWSGIVFITTGVVALIFNKRCTTRTYQASLLVNGASIVFSIIAVIIYSVDIHKEPTEACASLDSTCNAHFYATKLSSGLKSSLLVFTLAQTAVSAFLCFHLYRMKHTFGLYNPFSEATSSTPTTLT
ncbi:transmembrane protein 176 [Corythoichthys intestinalis]|uniref:transmembrane protein 176 n=1 Tax=Corythoichthys intestinalis TaxID=161448 RepID=UPI0025A56583|nr:transmembrane protein 176 [Corythoichthys intestinalis]XP_061792055.1 transmembrane protein 176B-like [Nerophis lumbriciformis]